MRFIQRTLHRSIPVVLAGLTLACGGGEEASVAVASAGDASAPAATKAPAETAPAPVPTEDLGALTFEVQSGPHAGTYGGPLSDQSSLSVRAIGEQQFVSFRIMHEREDGSTDVFNGTLVIEGALEPGDVDLAGQLVITGYLPDGVSHDERFFSYTAASGTGTLTIETVDVDAGTLKGTYTLTQDGIETIGRFDLKQ